MVESLTLMDSELLLSYFTPLMKVRGVVIMNRTRESLVEFVEFIQKEGRRKESRTLVQR